MLTGFTSPQLGLRRAKGQRVSCLILLVFTPNPTVVYSTSPSERVYRDIVGVGGGEKCFTPFSNLT